MKFGHFDDKNREYVINQSAHSLAMDQLSWQ